MSYFYPKDNTIDYKKHNKIQAIKIRRNSNINTSFYETPPTDKLLRDKLNSLRASFPFIKPIRVGQSVLGRELLGTAVGNTSRMVLLAGAFHGQEWLTSLLLVKLLEDIAVSCRDKLPFCGQPIWESLNDRGVMIVPLVNPDGTAIAINGPHSAGAMAQFVEKVSRTSSKGWQANARGVDLNHNFNAGFFNLKKLERENGITAPSPRQYGGEAPHSEPETRAMVSLISRYHFESVYAFHSQGEELFYEYGQRTPQKGRYIAELITNVCGYSLVQNGGLYSHGGFKDYFIDRTGRPGFTFEIGKGKNPLPVSDLMPIYEKLKEALLIAMIM